MSKKEISEAILKTGAKRRMDCEDSWRKTKTPAARADRIMRDSAGAAWRQKGCEANSDYSGLEHTTDEKPEMMAGATLWLSYGEKFFGPGVAQFFSLIDRYGSITDACAAMDLSYSKAHNIIKKMEKLLGRKMVLVQQGYRYGGSAALSVAARDLIARYDRYSKECFGLIKGAFDRNFEGYEWFGKKPGRRKAADDGEPSETPDAKGSTDE